MNHGKITLAGVSSIAYTEEDVSEWGAELQHQAAMCMCILVLYCIIAPTVKSCGCRCPRFSRLCIVYLYKLISLVTFC